MIYNFCVYAEKRDAVRKEQAAQAAVKEVIAHIHEPGSVIELKQKVDCWFILHREAQKKVANLA